MIRFKCPSCGMSLSAPEDCVGWDTNCRGCRRPVVVPRIAPTPNGIQPSGLQAIAKRVPTVPPNAKHSRRWPAPSTLFAAVLGILAVGGLVGLTVYRYLNRAQD